MPEKLFAGESFAGALEAAGAAALRSKRVSVKKSRDMIDLFWW
jgi:hypothetical protein